MTLFSTIKDKRKTLGLKTIEVAASLKIDQALISKFENGKRLPTKDQVVKLARLLQLDEHELLVLYTKELLLKYLSPDAISLEALSMVQEELSTYNKTKTPVSKSLFKLLSKIDKLLENLKAKRHLDSYRIAEALELEYTYNSNKIEGNTLTLQETNLVINEGLTIAGKTMREHLEAVNHKDAINFIKDIIDQETPLTEKVVLQLHQLILRGINGNYAGKYRNVQVVISGSSHEPPQAFLVPKQMEELFLWYNTNKAVLHPVTLAAEMHQKLVSIHPFIDGNGRTSRLIMNLILLKHGYVIANIKGTNESRMQYYEALDKSREASGAESFTKLVAQTELEDLERYLKILGKEKA